MCDSQSGLGLCCLARLISRRLKSACLKVDLRAKQPNECLVEHFRCMISRKTIKSHFDISIQSLSTKIRNTAGDGRSNSQEV